MPAGLAESRKAKYKQKDETKESVSIISKGREIKSDMDLCRVRFKRNIFIVTGSQGFRSLLIGSLESQTRFLFSKISLCAEFVLKEYFSFLFPTFLQSLKYFADSEIGPIGYSSRHYLPDQIDN